MHHTDRNTHRARYTCANIRQPLPLRPTWLQRVRAWLSI